MIVAGASLTHRLVARTDGDFTNWMHVLRGKLHDAFKHASDLGRRETVITMSSLFFDFEQCGRCQPRQMAACRLRRDVRTTGEFGRRKCSTIHQSNEHCGARGLASEKAYFRNLVCADYFAHLSTTSLAPYIIRHYDRGRSIVTDAATPNQELGTLDSFALSYFLKCLRWQI